MCLAWGFHILISFVPNKSPVRWIFLSQFTGEKIGAQIMYSHRNEKVKTMGCESTWSESPCWDEFSCLKCSCLSTGNHIKTFEFKMQAFPGPPHPNNSGFPHSWFSLWWIPAKPNFHPACPPGFTPHGKTTEHLPSPFTEISSSLGTLFQGQ